MMLATWVVMASATKRLLGKTAFLLSVGGMCVGWAVCAWALICTVEAPPVLSITDTTGPFTLTFTDFVNGTTSNTQAVTYTIQANNMAAGTVAGAVFAQLATGFTNVDLKGDVGSYTNLGDAEFATLSEAAAGEITIGTTATDLADKDPGTGQGDSCLDGTLDITWKGTLTADHTAGGEGQTMTVTVKDGQ